jgi:hypothetical protein
MTEAFKTSGGSFENHLKDLNRSYYAPKGQANSVSFSDTAEANEIRWEQNCVFN